MKRGYNNNGTEKDDGGKEEKNKDKTRRRRRRKKRREKRGGGGVKSKGRAGQWEKKTHFKVWFHPKMPKTTLSQLVHSWVSVHSNHKRVVIHKELHLHFIPCKMIVKLASCITSSQPI
jgi:hypothetical protein